MLSYPLADDRKWMLEWAISELMLRSIGLVDD